MKNFSFSDLKQGFLTGFSSSFSSWRRGMLTLFSAFIVFSITALSSRPGYSIQMLQSGFINWPLAVSTRFSSIVLTSGVTGAFLTLVFSLLVGATLTNTYVQFRMNSVSLDSLGAVPGFLAAGCASCGVGVLSILGLGGVLASLPFHGNSLRIGGVLVLVLLIARTGDPETCKV